MGYVQLYIVATIYHQCGWFEASLMMAAIVVLSGTFLLYTAVIAPAQIFLWESDEEECKVFPTLYIDLCVDAFFIVSFLSIMRLS